MAPQVVVLQCERNNKILNQGENSDAFFVVFPLA